MGEAVKNTNKIAPDFPLQKKKKKKKILFNSLERFVLLLFNYQSHSHAAVLVTMYWLINCTTI